MRRSLGCMDEIIIGTRLVKRSDSWLDFPMSSGRPAEGLQHICVHRSECPATLTIFLQGTYNVKRVPDKRDIANALREIGGYLDLSESNQFKARAYLNAARQIESVQMSMADFVSSGAIRSTPGIGKGIAPVIVELVEKGRSPYLEELRATYPPGILGLIEVPGLSIKKIRTLHDELGISSIEQLEEACRKNKLVSLPGFGVRTQQKLIEGIEFTKKHEASFLLSAAVRIAEELVAGLRELDGVENVALAGTVRRRLEVASDIVFCLSGPEPADLLQQVRGLALLSDPEDLDGGSIRARVAGGPPVVVHACTTAEFPTVLFLETGSDPFVRAVVERGSEQGFTLLRDGLRKRGRKVALSDEAAVFEKLDLPFVPPELRESGQLPSSRTRMKLVNREDLLGTFHVHSTYSDGKNSLTEMFGAARDRAFQYVGISDHSPTASYAGGLTESRLAQQQAEVESLRDQFKPMRIFKGTEADILADGGIDYDNATLAGRFDFVVASIHSRFKMEKDEMTERIVKALSNPFVTFLGHMTGRKLLSRDGYHADFDRVFDAAAENGVMIEINGDPHRLDIDWRLIPRALSRGVRFSIHPDAHSISNYNYLENGTWVARKAGLPPEMIFNTKPVEEVEEYLAERKARAVKGTKA